MTTTIQPAGPIPAAVLPPTEVNPWVTHESCEHCNGSGLVSSGVPWDPGDPEECDDCGGDGQIRRDWLREALLLAQGKQIGPFEIEAKHLQVLTAYYRQQISALITDVPTSLDRISNTLAGIATTCMELAGKERAA